MQANNENNKIHIKAVLNNEFRRFSLEKANFNKLEETIRVLYSLAPSQTLRVCFIDDEKDEVLISSDEELLYAVDLVNPVKLVITLVNSAVVFPSVETVNNASFRGCRRSRECTERREKLTKEERINFMIARITERIQHIEALLSTELPQQRVQRLHWKLTKLQKKLDFLKSGPTLEILTPTPEITNASYTENPEVSPFGRRGCRFRSERGCHRNPKTFEIPEKEGCGRKWGKKCDDPKWENVRAARQNLCAARRCGDQSQIEKCVQILQEAKQLAKADRQQQQQPKMGRPERWENKCRKWECVKDLREARVGGDPQQIQACEQALFEAREGLRRTKCVRK
jgi:hypothetical protein